MTSHKHQMSRHDRTWGASKVGGCDGRVEAPAADYAQGGRHVPSVGKANSGLCRSGVSHCLTCLPVNWRGLRAPSFSLRTAGGRCIGRQRRRLVASPPGRPAAALQFSAALLIGRSHQLYRIGNQLGRYSADPLHRSTPLYVVGFDTDEHKRGERESCSRNQRKRLTQ